MENEKNALSVIIDSAPQRIVTVHRILSGAPEKGNWRFPISSAVFPFLPDARLALSDGTDENRASISSNSIFFSILASAFPAVNEERRFENKIVRYAYLNEIFFRFLIIVTKKSVRNYREVLLPHGRRGCADPE